MILVTGASGFVGRELVQRLLVRGAVRGALRRPLAAALPAGVELAAGELTPDQDWSAVLSGVSAVVHCAARVHVMNDQAADPLAEFRRVNVDGTMCLARQAVGAGVRRFVFISSIGVNGGETKSRPYSATDEPAPHTPYAVSKCEAELALFALAKETPMELVVIRPPLIYGPDAPGNFATLMKALIKGVPLPLSRIVNNRRSFVFIDNLVDLIVTCLDHPGAANQTFLVSDGESLSTAALLRRMGDALGRPARLIPVPVPLLQTGAALLGKRDMAQRLCGSLEVDIGKTTELLGWIPPISVDEGLRRTAAHWMASQQAAHG